MNVKDLDFFHTELLYSSLKKFKLLLSNKIFSQIDESHNLFMRACPHCNATTRDNNISGYVIYYQYSTMYCFFASKTLIYGKKTLGFSRKTCYFMIQCIVFMHLILLTGGHDSIKQYIITQLELGVIPSQPFKFY